MSPEVAAILEFWFGARPHRERREWFVKDAAFDALIRERFGATIDATLAGADPGWEGTAHGALARVVLLDQFTRNAYRDTPKAFAGDALALATARAAIGAGQDLELDAHERWFLYMPFEHAEDREAQRESIAHFTRLAGEGALPGPLVWAEKHAEVIRRFGRYPHRNAILGRPSTPEELAFLREPGSSF